MQVQSRCLTTNVRFQLRSQLRTYDVLSILVFRGGGQAVGESESVGLHHHTAVESSGRPTALRRRKGASPEGGGG